MAYGNKKYPQRQGKIKKIQANSTRERYCRPFFYKSNEYVQLRILSAFPG